MLEDVVIPQRLLDHEQLKVIELAQMLQVARTIGGIRIAAQQDPRPALANLRQHFQVPSWLHLYFDSLIAGVKLGLDFFQQLLLRILNADRNSAGNLVELAAEQLPQRLLLLVALRVPEGILQRRLGHVVSTYSGHSLRRLFAARQSRPNHCGHQKVAQCCPCRLHPLVTEEWAVAGHALSPALHSFAVHGNQQYAAALAAAKAGLKEIFQRHAKFADGDGFDLHECLVIATSNSEQVPVPAVWPVARATPIRPWSRSEERRVGKECRSRW